MSHSQSTNASRPAFRWDEFGLTKRETFALAALQGILTHGHNDLTYEAVVRDAVTYADRLLEELAK